MRETAQCGSETKQKKIAGAHAKMDFCAIDDIDAKLVMIGGVELHKP